MLAIHNFTQSTFAVKCPVRNNNVPYVTPKNIILLEIKIKFISEVTGITYVLVSKFFAILLVNTCFGKYITTQKYQICPECNTNLKFDFRSS